MRATPELRLTIEGVPHRVKFYFKEPKIIQAGANLVIHLHEAAGWADGRIAVFDVRRAKLFTKHVWTPTTRRSFARRLSRS